MMNEIVTWSLRTNIILWWLGKTHALLAFKALLGVSSGWSVVYLEALTAEVLLDEAGKRLWESWRNSGSVLIAARADWCRPEPADVTPPPGLMTESRRIKGFCTSLCECDKENKSGTKRLNRKRGGEKRESRVKRGGPQRQDVWVCWLCVHGSWVL